jgi:hypothetical protein
LKVKAGLGSAGIGPYGMLNQSAQPTHFLYLSNVDLPYQQ